MWVRTAVSFFFSSRRRHTRWTGDWSSDVCSSDLSSIRPGPPPIGCWKLIPLRWAHAGGSPDRGRSEERRVGKSVDLGGRRIIKKKKNHSTQVRITDSTEMPTTHDNNQSCTARGRQ